MLLLLSASVITISTNGVSAEGLPSLDELLSNVKDNIGNAASNILAFLLQNPHLIKSKAHAEAVQRDNYGGYGDSIGNIFDYLP